MFEFWKTINWNHELLTNESKYLADMRDLVNLNL